jgi:hypothetical protein
MKIISFGIRVVIGIAVACLILAYSAPAGAKGGGLSGGKGRDTGTGLRGGTIFNPAPPTTGATNIPQSGSPTGALERRSPSGGPTGQTGQAATGQVRVWLDRDGTYNKVVENYDGKGGTMYQTSKGDHGTTTGTDSNGNVVFQDSW